MTTKQLLSSNSYIQYPKFLGFYIGVNEAILLSALCDKDSLCEYTYENYNGWFYYIKDEIEIDTGLSDSQQRTALKSLIDLHIVNTERHNCPSRVYYNIDTDILENVLNEAYNEYKAHKSQRSQNMTTSGSENMTTSGIKNRISTIDKNKDIKINNKSTGAGASSKNHSQVYKQRTTLSDDLKSGKDIDEQEKSKKKSPKEKFKDECYSLIDNFVTDNHLDYAVHDLLIEYFDFISDIKQADGDNKRKVVRNTSTWETKLNNQLLKLIENGYNPIDIVRQSLDQKKYKFWEPDLQNNSGHETIQNNIKIRTLEEAKQDMQKKKERGVPTF